MRITVDLPDELVAQLDGRLSVDGPGKSSRPRILAEDLSALYDLEDHTRAALSGRFTKAELGYVLEVVNGWAISWPGPSPDVMLHHEVIDAARLEGLNRKWFGDDEAAWDAFLQKVEPAHLTPFEAYVLLREAKLAWSAKDPMGTLCERIKPKEEPGEDAEAPRYEAGTIS